MSKYNLIVDRFQIDQYLKSISQNNIQKLKNKFKNLSLDFELFEKYVETELKWQKYIYQIYSEKINIDANQVKDELDELVKENKKILEYNLSEIEIADEKKEQINKKINDINNKILKDGFNSTALNYSISDTSFNKGYIGWVSSKELSKDIFDIIKDMKKMRYQFPLKDKTLFYF